MLGVHKAGFRREGHNLSKYENKTIIHNTNMVDKACSYCFLHVHILPLYSQMQAA